MAASKNAAKTKESQPTANNLDPKQDHSGVEYVQSNDTICVGCKLPHGLHLDFRMPGEPTQRVTLKGTNSLNHQEGVIIQPVSRIGGFAITHGVPREFFEKWMQDNRFHPAVKNHLIFAHEEAESVMAMGKEYKDIKSGLDPIDPTKPAIKGVETFTNKEPGVAA